MVRFPLRIAISVGDATTLHVVFPVSLSRAGDRVTRLLKSSAGTAAKIVAWGATTCEHIPSGAGFRCTQTIPHMIDHLARGGRS